MPVIRAARLGLPANLFPCINFAANQPITMHEEDLGDFKMYDLNMTHTAHHNDEGHEANC